LVWSSGRWSRLSMKFENMVALALLSSASQSRGLVVVNNYQTIL
jgi:hypothetical protein